MDHYRPLFAAALEAQLQGDDASAQIQVLSDYLDEQHNWRPPFLTDEKQHLYLWLNGLRHIPQPEREWLYCDFAEEAPVRREETEHRDALLAARRSYLASHTRQLQRPKGQRAVAPSIGLVAAERAWGGSPRTPRLCLRAHVEAYDTALSGASWRRRPRTRRRRVEQVFATRDQVWARARHQQIRLLLASLRRPQIQSARVDQRLPDLPGAAATRQGQ